MARVELQGPWLAQGEIADLRERLRAFFKKHKMSIDDEEGDEFLVSQGSQVLSRLLGLWLSPPKWFPKTAKVRLKNTPQGVKVQALIEEDIGFGFMDPISKKKYESFFEKWMDDSRGVVR